MVAVAGPYTVDELAANGPRVIRDIQALAVSELRTAARQLVGRKAAHWSLLAALIGRIEDERMYEQYGYETGPAFTEQELDLDVGDYGGSLKLWRLMEKALPDEATRRAGVPLNLWSTVPLARARLVRRMVALGGDPLVWFEKARLAESTTALRAEVQKVLGKESWVSFVVKAPKDVVEKLFEPALVLALSEATGDHEATADRALRRDTRFRCLESILAHYVAMGRRPAVGSGTLTPETEVRVLAPQP